MCFALRTLSALALSIALLPATARAAEVSSSAIVHDDAGICIYLTASLDDNLVTNGAAFNYASCTSRPWPKRVVPVGQLIYKEVLYVWSWNTLSWQTLHEDDWKENDSAIFAQGWGQYLRGTGQGGYYMLERGAFAWDGQAWQGGWIFTNYIYSSR